LILRIIEALSKSNLLESKLTAVNDPVSASPAAKALAPLWSIFWELRSRVEIPEPQSKGKTPILLAGQAKRSSAEPGLCSTIAREATPRSRCIAATEASSVAKSRPEL